MTQQQQQPNQANQAQPLHLVPAYGRDYKTAAEALSDWTRGLDFRIMDTSSPYYGAYCSCRDFTRAESVLIRYNHRTNFTNFLITGGLKHPTRNSTI